MTTLLQILSSLPGFIAMFTGIVALLLVVSEGVEVWRDFRRTGDEERQEAQHAGALLHDQANDAVAAIQSAYWRAKQQLREEADGQ
ncbi:MAG: hypothetical protein QM589_17445 [Thermomicrobiales bacterium]